MISKLLRALKSKRDTKDPAKHFECPACKHRLQYIAAINVFNCAVCRTPYAPNFIYGLYGRPKD